MGDDLIFAQKFTRTAADGLALLVKMEDPRAAQDASVVIDMMTTVQRGAKRLRARHIYSGAQGVLSALHHENDATLESRIECLGSLVTEYARGLDELLQTPNTAPVITSLDKWDMARENLNALLPIASSDDADMLSRLMRAPVTFETVQPEQDPIFMDADIVPFAKAEMPDEVETTSFEDLDLEDAIPTATVKPTEDTFSLPVESKIENGPSVALDAMMRDVIADALSVARTVGRTISLSYDMGDRTVSEKDAVNLQARLGRALSQIIRQSLTADRVGHIDINLAGEQLHIMAGTTAVRVAIDPENAPKKPALKPLITEETEQGLRAQLNALMDPITLHETAS